MQDMSKLMVHSVEIPVVEEVDVEILEVETVDVTESNLHTALSHTDIHRTVGVILRRTDKMYQFWAIGANECRAHHLGIGIKPQVFRQLRHSHSLVVFGRREVITSITLVELKAILKLYVVFIDIVGLEPSVEIVLRHGNRVIEHALGVEVFVAAGPK